MKLHIEIESLPAGGKKKLIASYGVETPSLLVAVKMAVGGVKELCLAETLAKQE